MSSDHVELEDQISQVVTPIATIKKIETSDGLNALIVEDESELLNYMGEVVNGLGFSVKLASNGLEALEQIARCKFDLIVTDLRMPVVDGHQLIEKIKSLEDNRPRLICITTGDEMISNDKKIIQYDSGEVVELEHLQKPIDLAIFKKNVNQFFGS